MKGAATDSATFQFGEHALASGVKRFAHSAMATLFEIYCAHSDAEYAAQAARAAFDLVDRLEADLSRFFENSDISRINSLQPDQCTRVSPWTLECLQTARRMFFETGKAFDISIGSGLDTLEIIPDEMVVCASASGARLDLGGIGKGYAVDCMAELLEEWEITRVLLHGGFSSVLALDPPPNCDGWTLTLSAPGQVNREILARVSARQRALSASGTQKGNHIVDPRSGRPIKGRLASWVSLPRVAAHPSETPTMTDCLRTERAAATVAEALSTAFMILADPEVAACCKRWVGMEAWLVTTHPEPGSGGRGLLHLCGPGCGDLK